MKLSDFFTTIRIVLAPVFFVLFFLPQWIGAGNALSAWILVPLFAFMEFTDFLDGYFARKANQVSDFGKLFDPFADVLANLTVLFCFVLSGYLPAVLFLIILYREIGIMFVRSLASRRGVAIAARKGGKAKTFLYVVSTAISLAIEAAMRLDIGTDQFLNTARSVNLVFYILAVAVSLVSFIDYIVHFSSVLRKPA